MRHFAPAQGAQESVRLHLTLAEHLGKRARSNMTPGIHLPESVLRVDKTLCIEQVMHRAGIDVWDTHFVAINIDRTIQALQMDLSINLWKGFGCDFIWKVTLELEKPGRRKQQGNDDNTDH